MKNILDRLKKIIKRLEYFKIQKSLLDSLNRLSTAEGQYKQLSIFNEKYNKIYSDTIIILVNIFGEKSNFLKNFKHLTILEKNGLKYFNVEATLGILKSALENIEGGYIEGIEFQISNQVFDNLLEESKNFIFKQKNKDIGAILLRIVLEDNLKRICKKEKIEIQENGRDKKTSLLNQELKKKGHYNQTQWRQIDTWLDIGNTAHHGKFDEYNLNEVKNFYTGLENFIVSYFKKKL